MQLFKISLKMRTILIWYLLVIGTLCVTARSRRGLKSKQKTPYYRSLEELNTSDEDPKISTKTKLIVIKARNNDGNEGRFLKHILLYRQLLEQPKREEGCSKCGYGGGHGGGGNGYGYIPYIIINNPTNLTNINNNTNTNVPADATATATGGTGTGTGTGTGGGAIRYNYLSNSQALPYALPVAPPTQVFQQRQQPVPQVVYGVPLNAVNSNKRRRNGNGNGNGYGNGYGNGNVNGYGNGYGNGNGNRNPNQNNKKRTSNPFSTFANSFKRIQFL